MGRLRNWQFHDANRYLKASLAKLRVLNRKAARQLKGSNRQKETYRQIARLHAHIASQRTNFLHKLSRKLVKTYDLVAIEDLNLAFMNRGTLARASLDAGFGNFRRMLVYKGEENGVQVVAVNPSGTSQRCSGCGEVVRKNLGTRVHECPGCGIVLDRDVNAARNILQASLRIKQLGRK